MSDDLFDVVASQELVAKDFGFYWENFDQLLEQVQSECLEVQEAWKNDDHPHLKEEIGDLIQAAISLAVFCGVDPKTALVSSTQKFQRRYDVVLELARQDGHVDFHSMSFDQMMDYWNRAKQRTQTAS